MSPFRDEQLRRFEAVINASPDFIAISGLDGKVEFLNKAGRTLVGMPDEIDVALTEFDDYLTPEGIVTSSENERPSVVRDGHWSGVGTLRDWRGGPPVPVEISSFVVSDVCTGVPGAVATVQRDLRAQLEAERELTAAHMAVRESQDFQKALLVHMCNLLVVIRPDGTLKSTSPAAGPSLGYEPGVKIGTSMYDLIHSEDRERIADRIADVASRPGLSRPLDVRLLAADGSWRRYEFVANNLLDDPTIAGIMIAARDVTAQKLTERALVSQARILELIARGTVLGEVLNAVAEEVEAQLADTMCSVLLTEGSGGSRVLRYMAAPSMPDAYSVAVDRLSVHTTVAPCCLAARTNQPVFVADLFEGQEWQEFWALATTCGVRACWSVPVRSPATEEMLGTFALYQATPGLPGPETLEVVERASNLIGIAVDRDRFEARLTHQATHDELTGLANRTLLVDRLDQALARHRRDATRVPVVVFVNVDRLKIINDSLGHDRGDALLAELAHRLTDQIRAIDTVARFSGDEFVIVAEVADAKRGPIELVERILAAITEPIELAGHLITPSGSAGVVIATGYDSASKVIRDADIAMYRAKQKGGSGYEFFDASMWDRAVERLNIEAQIRRGIANGEFRLLYQPIIELVDHAVVGFEALVRWSHPEHGLLGPGSFIDLAEETGLIVELGEWVLEEAARTVAAWDVPSAQKLELSINVSSRQLSSTSLLGRVDAARAAIWPTALCLELTESTLMNDTVTGRDMIERLISTGTSLSIDDFGTGYSSLSYLTRLPVTTLKIDRSFVSALGVVAEAETVAAAILSLAAQLGLKVIAEGVETVDQERVLFALGCRTAQGFLFHRPLASDKARALLGP